jgi:hypothetical protein
MRINLLLFLCLLFFTGNGIAQSKSYSRALSAGFQFPFGNFAATHFPGIAVEFAAAKHRFGRMPAKPVQKLVFTYGGGIHYYFGKKETVSGYTYRYPEFAFIHVAGGAVYNPHKQVNIRLTTGPALSRYNSSTRFNVTAALSASYYLRKRWGITPSVMMINETAATPIWTAGLNTSFAF